MTVKNLINLLQHYDENLETSVTEFILMTDVPYQNPLYGDAVKNFFSKYETIEETSAEFKAACREMRELSEPLTKQILVLK